MTHHNRRLFHESNPDDSAPEAVAASNGSATRYH